MTSPTSRIIACVGAGVIGRSWAIAFARAGLRVNIFDVDSECRSTCLNAIAQGLAQTASSESGDSLAAMLDRIVVAPTLEQAVAGADYVQESATERLTIKTSLFADLDRLTGPTTVLASSTSELSSSLFTESLPGRSRCLVVHPLNPPHVIPVVEIVPSRWTSPEAVAISSDIMKGIGQDPIVVRKDWPGFAINRLQLALIGEALHLVGEGVISADDVDKVITRGLALRWAILGPFAAGHLNSTRGYLDYVTKFEGTLRSITSDLQVDYPWDFSLVSEINDHLERRIPVTEIPEWQDRRDREIADLRRHLERQTDVRRKRT